MFRYNLPPALLAEIPGSFTCHCGNTGMERTPNKSQHTKLTLEKKILPPLLPVFELATCRSRVRRSNQQAIPVRRNDTQYHMFWSLLIFGGHSAREPASVVPNDEQDDPFYSADPHRRTASAAATTK